ncbi:MAG TPA: NUDIX domain-containing protein [Chlamydiales bacterium]|nr:NUDIX domain-containing protein [Chlamydiales bacterium]
MTKPLSTRKSVKILLINPDNKILLMQAEDPKITSKEGNYHGRFWFPVGGGLEENETIKQAAIRELYEETGLLEKHVTIGPIVWHGAFELNINNVLTQLDQTFIVMKTKEKEVRLHALCEWEKQHALNLAWFSYEEICNCEDVIYPLILKSHLQDILNEKYPSSMIEVDLSLQPS